MKPSRSLRVLTWHVHGNYLHYLSHIPHELWLVTDAHRTPHHTGRSGTLPWHANVHEVPIDQVRHADFDVVLFQSRAAWEDEQYRYLSTAQQRGPRIYLEHDPPQQHPTDTRHWMDDPEVLLVHVTPFNALMWDNGHVPVRVIEHGVRLLREVRHHGDLARGLVAVNHIDRRGRRLGADVYRAAAQRVPLTLVGLGSELCGGEGPVANDQLPERMAAHRFFFNPIRHTSLGLSVIEAMLVGAPVVALSTTELSSVVRDGDTGFADTRLDRLIDVMQRLLHDPAEARRVGEAGRRMAAERFSIDRFVSDWDSALRQVTS
ncbi:MAG: glycosyltransferase family 4 protein [Burkholderiaceae bacterium]|nr:glycosyltransferase family 4 protein [Burkholderiaceae bacterium]